VADLARALPGRGYAAGVFCTSKLGVHADALRRAGIPVWNCRDPSFRIPGLPIRLIARLRGFGPSIVHAQSGAWLPATVACAALDGADLVFTEHGRDLRQPRWRTLADRWCARRTRRVTAVSTEAALRLQALVALDAAPDVIHNGVAPESTPRRSRARGARRAGAVRRVARALGRTARIDQEPCVAHRGALASRRCSPGARSDRRQGHGQRRRPFLELLHGLEVVGVRELDPLLAEKLDDSTLRFQTPEQLAIDSVETEMLPQQILLIVDPCGVGIASREERRAIACTVHRIEQLIE